MNDIINVENTKKQGRAIVEPEIGQWFWIKSEKVRPDYKMEGSPDPEYSLFAVAFAIGSNYVKFSTEGTGISTSMRIHFNELDDMVIYEPNHKRIIEMNCKIYGKKIQENLNEIKKVTSSLGVTPSGLLDAPSDKPGLVPVTSNVDAKVYKKALIKAKEETIPELFQTVENNQKHLKRCMSLEALGMKALVNSYESVLGVMNKRIFNISLYAGLTEEVELIRDGASAQITDKVHLMQRRLYMDEECLFNYTHGGMEFADINEFDKWLAKDENFHRCLPFPKTIVTFRVRRKQKTRYARSMAEMFINFQIAEADKYTFMYIRNGDKLYRISTDMDFGEMIFPNLTDFDPQSPKMIKNWGSSLKDVISTKDWEYFRDEERKKKAAYEQWWIDNPYEKWLKDNNKEDNDGNDFCYRCSNPHRDTSSEHYDSDSWQPLDKDNVYYDEGMEYINDKIEEYNRIALIVQGLLDRTDILDPLPPVNLKDQQDFRDRVKLLYDGEHVLYDGEKPSIEDYINYCNSQITKESIFIGQVDFWERKEGEKENERDYKRYMNGEIRDYHEIERFRPYGNPGPFHISQGKLQPRVRKVKFEWQREIVNYQNPNYGNMTNTSITVPIDKLFNVSAYKLGDYRRFFQDPRTREEYLKWAPMLLAAEEYHAGTWKESRDRYRFVRC